MVIFNVNIWIENSNAPVYTLHLCCFLFSPCVLSTLSRCSRCVEIHEFELLLLCVHFGENCEFSSETQQRVRITDFHFCKMNGMISHEGNARSLEAFRFFFFASSLQANEFLASAALGRIECELKMRFNTETVFPCKNQKFIVNNHNHYHIHFSWLLNIRR